MRLRDKVAIITGAASGVGRASALLFSAEGARLALLDVNAPRGEEVAAQVRSGGGEALFVRADVSREDEVKTAVQLAVERYQRVDILCNNAGVLALCRVENMASGDWSTVLDTNLKGTALMCKHVIPHMVNNGKGSVVNTASVLAIVGDPDMPAYCASKGGLVALTRSLAVAYGPQGVRVNAICPGDIDTPMLREYFAQTPNPEDAMRSIVNSYPLQRIATADDIAYAALYLASDESAFVTGASLVVDGGLTVKCY